jgi:hypothetical protein
MNYRRLTHKILQRLLREAESEIETRGRRRLSQSNDMALHTFKRGGMPAAIMYNAKFLLDGLDDIDVGTSEPSATAWYAMRGVIQIAKTPLHCNGAWEIKYSAVKNKGDGGLIYGVAFAMSPKGILTPDRHQVSYRAQDGWLKQASRGGKPFDDFYAPRSKKLTPNDTSDDCTMHVEDFEEDGCVDGHIDVDSLNRSYESEGWETQLFDKMRATHEEVLQQTPSELANKIFASMEKSFMPFFHTNL